MKFLELFAGIGGIGHGLTQAGMECVGYVEMDKHAHQSYEILHDPNRRLWNGYDIRDITNDDIRSFGRKRGPVSLLAAGFPCQAFSIAGKREGFKDRTRGTLFFEVVRFASILRPEFLFLENVDGLRNHDNGRTLGIILSALDEMGYVGGWQVLNSSAYVPQNRERIYIVASLGNERAREVFPFGRENGNAIDVVGRLEEKGNDYIKRVYGVGGISPALPTMQGGGQEPKVLVTKRNDELCIRDIATCLDANYHKGLDSHQARTGVLEKIPGENDIAKTIRASGRGSYDGKHTHDLVAIPVLTPDRPEKGQNGRRFKEPGEPSFTLTAQDRHGVYEGYRIRKLTPLECFRLQSYPDWWYVKLKLFRHPEYIDHVDMSRNDITAQVMMIIRGNGLKEGISDSQLYKMGGNGVTSAVAYDIASRILELSELR